MRNIETTYPGQSTAADADYPAGSAKNETSPGAFDGTPFELELLNDIFGMMQSALRAAGKTANNTTETARASQFLRSMIELMLGRGAFMATTGSTANTYLLDSGVTQGPVGYFDGLRVRCQIPVSNTGGSTLNVDSLGAKDIRDASGAVLVGGSLVAGTRYEFEYRLADDHFRLVGAAGGGGTGVNTLLDNVNGRWTDGQTGFTAEWGQVAKAAAPVGTVSSVTFPEALDTVYRGFAIAAENNGSFSEASNPSAFNETTTGMSVQSGRNGTGNVNWFVFGKINV